MRCAGSRRAFLTAAGSGTARPLTLHSALCTGSRRRASHGQFLVKWVASDQGQRRIAEGGRMCNLAENNEKIWGPIASRDYNFKNVQAFLQTQKFGSIDVVGGVSEDQITRDGGLGQSISDIMDGKVTAKEAL